MGAGEGGARSRPWARRTPQPPASTSAGIGVGVRGRRARGSGGAEAGTPTARARAAAAPPGAFSARMTPRSRPQTRPGIRASAGAGREGGRRPPRRRRRRRAGPAAGAARAPRGRPRAPGRRERCMQHLRLRARAPRAPTSALAAARGAAAKSRRGRLRHAPAARPPHLSHPPFFIMTCRNLMTTLDEGRTSTWRLPRFSALVRLRRASLRTLMRTMV